MTFTDNGNGTATLAGTPGTVGTYPMTITADNGVGSPGQQSFTLTVDQSAAITSAPDMDFCRGNGRQLHR